MTADSVSIAATDFHCVQCGGSLQPDAGQIFMTCPYCGSAVYLDKSKVVFHWSLASTVSSDQALAALRRWMAGNQTVKDLDRKAEILTSTFQYFPLWYVKARREDKETVYIEPAAAISIMEIKSLQIPAGDLQKYDAALDAMAVAPTVPLPAMLEWLGQRGVEPQEVIETALIHLPVYVYKYRFGGRVYTALVEGASGRVLASIFPAKREAPYLLVTAVATAGFMCLATFPAIGYFTAGAAGASVGLLACLFGGVLFAVPVFALALFVSAKV